MSAVLKEMEGGGACVTPNEQEGDGVYFGGGGVVWKSAVVRVLGWLPAATKRGEGKKKVMKMLL